MKNYKKNKKLIIAITGHSGVLGSEFVRRYPDYDYLFFKGNLLKKKDVDNWLKIKSPDVILHLAAKVPVNYVDKNLSVSKKISSEGTLNILNNIKKKKLTNVFFLFTSTSHIYKKTHKKISETWKEQPSSNYGKFKLLAEKKIKNFSKNNDNFNYCIARIFSFTNYNQNESFLIPALYKKIYKNNKKYINNLDSHRDFIHIEDLCDALNLLISKRAKGIFNIGSGKKTRVLEIAKLIAKISNKKNIKYDTSKNSDNKDCYLANISKIKRLGWRPKKNIYKILNEFIKKKHEI